MITLDIPPVRSGAIPASKARRTPQRRRNPRNKACLTSTTGKRAGLWYHRIWGVRRGSMRLRRLSIIAARARVEDRLEVSRDGGILDMRDTSARRRIRGYGRAGEWHSSRCTPAVTLEQCGTFLLAKFDCKWRCSASC